MISCSKEKDNDPVIEKANSKMMSDRLNFSNFSEMLGLYTELAKKDPNELLLWAKTKNHSTLLESQDTTIMNYSNALKTILNKDYEFQVGDTIIRFINGEFLAYPKIGSQETDLAIMKKIGHVELSKDQSNSIGNKGSVTLYAGQIDATPQHEFIITQYIPCEGTPEYGIFGYRKYVCDLYHEFIFIDYYWPLWLVQTSAYLRIKLEYRTSKSNWYICSNQHVINYHIYGTAEFTMDYGDWDTRYFDFYRSSQGGCDNYVTIPLNVLLATRSAMTDDYTQGSRWRITINGYITQQINGDPHPNTFSSSVSPWWGL